MDFAALDMGWWWAIGGLILLMAELVIPGVYLLFIGWAALATGGLALATGLGFSGQAAMFVLSAAISVAYGHRSYGRHSGPTRVSDRASQMIGKVYVAASDIDASSGRVIVGDGQWNARGGPAKAGDKVVVTGLDGSCLLVEPSPAWIE